MNTTNGSTGPTMHPPVHTHSTEPNQNTVTTGTLRPLTLRRYGAWALALALLLGTLFTPLAFGQSEDAENGEEQTSAIQSSEPASPDAAQLGLEPGALIVAVQPDSPAAQAGIVRGDILLTFDKLEIADALSLVAAITDSEPGADVELSWLHGSETRSATITLTDLDDVAFLGVQPYLELEQELRLRLERTLGPDANRDESTRRLLRLHWPDADRLAAIQGVVIVDVAEDGPAAQGGLAPRDIIVSLNGEPMTSADELQTAVRALEPQATVTLEVITAQALTAWSKDIESNNSESNDTASEDTASEDTANRDAEIAPETVTVVLGELPDDPTVPYLGVRVLSVSDILECGMFPHKMMERGIMHGGMMGQGMPGMGMRMGPGMMDPELHSEMRGQMHSEMRGQMRGQMPESMGGMMYGCMRGMMQERMDEAGTTTDGQMRGRFFMGRESHMGWNFLQWGMNMLERHGIKLPGFRHFWTPDTESNVESNFESESEDAPQPFPFRMTPRGSDFF